MSKVTLSILTVEATLPAGVVAGALRYSYAGADGVPVASVDSAELSASFDGVADGDYVATVARLDANGTILGSPVSAGFSVAHPVPNPTPDPVPTPAPATYAAPSMLNVLVELN